MTDKVLLSGVSAERVQGRAERSQLAPITGHSPIFPYQSYHLTVYSFFSDLIPASGATMPTSTHTHLDLLSLPDRSALRQAFIGQPLSALRSPALIVDRKVFVDNCERVTKATAAKGLRFRAHVKSEPPHPRRRSPLQRTRPSRAHGYKPRREMALRQ